MISRAARVPRICLACRFGLITQRSAGVGFRLSPAREGLGRRFYASDIGKAGDSKVEPFISERDVSETRPEENTVVEETIETPTESKDATTTTTTNNPSSTETDPDPTQKSEEIQLSVDSEANASPLNSTHNTATSTTESPPDQSIDSAQASLDDLLGEPSSSFTPETTSYDVSELLELSSDRPASSAELELDDLLGELSTSRKPEDGISELPELEDDFQDQETFTPIPKRPYRDRFVHGEALGVPTLGLPADAIVINNPNMTRMTRKPPTVIEAQELETAGLGEALAPSEKVEPGEEEIYANIDECRPDTRILRSADINKLVHALCNGFTVSQLKDYHRDCPPEHRETDNVDYAWIEEMAPWTSVNSIQIRGSSKTSIAQRIVFDRWKIEVQEHVDNLGKAFIWMDPDIFPFLTYGPNNIGRLLWELRRDFLVGEDEKLTLNTDKSRISIIARKSTTYGVLAYIDQAVQQMQTRTIDVSPFLPSGSSIPTISELRELGRITKTSIQRVKEGKTEKLRVSWMPEPLEAPTETEDLADTVFRLVVGRVVPGSQSTLQCTPSNGEDEVIGSPLLQVQRQARAMSWRDRLNKWYRVAAPIDKAGEKSLPLNLTTSASLPQTKAGSGENKDATTATFGHILHSDAYTSTKTLSRNRRILSPLTPHPASFSALKPDNDKPLKESTTIVMHLVPRVELKSSAGRTEKSAEDPAVRIKIPVNADADLANFTIPSDMVAECFVPWQIHDVLLPTEAVDVRLKHERSYSLKVNQPGLQKFLETSQFNLLEGQLRTPSQATLSVPGSWMAGRHSVNSNSKKKDVLYDFRGTEIHQTVEMPWRGHTLRYSSIEAGQHGGQRQEITLRAGTPEEDQVAFQGERKESFLKLVEDIATGKCFSWSEGYKVIKSRQLEDYSYNLPEEELSEDIIIDNEKFDSRGRLNFKLYEEKPKRTRQTKTFNHFDKNMKAEFEPEVETTPEFEVEPTSEPTPEPKAGEDPVNTADDLMAFLDTYAKPKAFKDSDNNKVYGVAAATNHGSPRSKRASDNPTSDSPRVKDETREHVLNEYFSDHATPAKSPTSRSTTSESNTMFTASEAVDKPTRASNKPTKKSKKYTLRDLEKPASKSSEDAFTAQFASRATGENRARDPNAVPGFFDPPPQSEKKSTQKRGSKRAKVGGWNKKGRKG
ncbi:hypothetical protein ACHAPU_000156 [Fusarium lateritium]